MQIQDLKGFIAFLPRGCPKENEKLWQFQKLRELLILAMPAPQHLSPSSQKALRRGDYQQRDDFEIAYGKS
jgi:hypothetical protein